MQPAAKLLCTCLNICPPCISSPPLQGPKLASKVPESKNAWISACFGERPLNVPLARARCMLRRSACSVFRWTLGPGTVAIKSRGQSWHA